MKLSNPRAVLLLFTFVALSCALPEAKHLVARLFDPCYYLMQLVRYLLYIILVWCRLRRYIILYDGTVNTYQPLYASVVSWPAAIANATIAQQSVTSGSASVADGQQIVDVLTSNYEPELIATINDFIAKQKTFVSSGQSKALGVQFKYVQGNQTILNNAVLANLPNDATVKSGAQSVINKINSDISSLVAAFPAS